MNILNLKVVISAIYSLNESSDYKKYMMGKLFFFSKKKEENCRCALYPK